jgi:hypothetical protein
MHLRVVDAIRIMTHPHGRVSFRPDGKPLAATVAAGMAEYLPCCYGVHSTWFFCLANRSEQKIIEVILSEKEA